MVYFSSLTKTIMQKLVRYRKDIFVEVLYKSIKIPIPLQLSWLI